MYPINQVILGGDPLLGNSGNIDEQLKMAEAYQQKLKAIQELQSRQQTTVPSQKLIWDEIDTEVAPLTSEQKNRLFQDEEYAELYNHLQEMVQSEILSLVKSRIESTPEGKQLLEKQAAVVKKLKSKIVDESNKEMDIFRKFREYVKVHPNATYEEFIKEII